MKSKKTIAAWAVVGLSLVALAACGPTTSDSSSEVPGSGTTSGSTSIVNPGPTTRRIVVTLKTYTIPQGSTFFDGCQPSVVYQNDETGEELEVYNYTNKTKYTITNKDTQETYEAGDALPTGNYTCDVRYSQNGYLRSSVNFTVTEATPEVASEGKGYTTFNVSDLAKYEIQNFDGIETLGGGGMPATGDVKILVIPIQFENVKFGDDALVKSVLNEAFFGESEDTPWESLHSYYKKSSYGKLNIGGIVVDPMTYPVDDRTLDASNTSFSTTVCTWAVNQLKAKGMDMTDYDADGDGYIDGVEIVYCTSQQTPGSTGDVNTGSNDLWWNFTTNTSSGPNKASPTAHRLFWSRWDFVTNSYYATSTEGISYDGKKVDAHTIIHETGHMMGAPDYYSYDRNEGPAGQVDMMDNNVGDHNAYTKMIYNWVAPRVIDGSSKNFTITLNSFVDTGDFLLVKPTSDPWNETPYDEYLILQYYTPTGVNEMDSTGYPEWNQPSTGGSGNVYGHGGTYEHPGLQVFHVDTRVAADFGDLNDKGEIIDSSVVRKYTDDPQPEATYDNEGKKYQGAAHRVHDNTPSRSTEPDGSPSDARELQAIFPSGVNSTDTNSYYSSFGDMSHLFGLDSYRETGDNLTTESYYGGSTYSNYRLRDFFPNDLAWNDGSTFDWTFSVVDQTDDTITLHFINTSLN